MDFIRLAPSRPDVKIDWNQWHFANPDSDDDLCGADFDCPVCGSVAGQCCSDENGCEWSSREHKERRKLAT